MTGERRFHGSSISDGEAGCSIFTACGTSHKFIYGAQVKKDIALQCGVDESDCRIKMDDMKITLIRVRVKNADKMQKEWQNELAFRYGVEEEKIWIEEA